MNTPLDQRHAPRIPVHIPAKIICTDKETILGHVTNLSEGGFFCSLKKPLVPDTKINFVLLFPPVETEKDRKSQSFCGQGAIVREVDPEETGLRDSQEFSMSIKFTELDEKNRERLGAFIREFHAA